MVESKQIPDQTLYDSRFPYFLGNWTRSIPQKNTGPAKDDFDEPHIKRKIAILNKYPQIKELFGYDPRTQYITYAAVSAQLLLAYYFGKVYTGNYFWFFAGAYFLGGTISALYGVIFHEITHNLAAKTSLANRWVGMIANIPMIVPIAQSFRRYHLEHHTYQGVEGHDPDLPLEWEVKYVGNNTIYKFFWLLIYGVMYIGRGLAQQKQLSTWEIYNIIWTVACDIVMYRLFGLKGILYLVASVLFGYGPHPGAAHFIQEHYTYIDGQETYNYYGSGNKFYMNIGFHNEHHDFHMIPWSRLPQVKAIAKDFYDNMAYHDSWFRVLYLFVTCKLMAPQSRLVRSLETHRYSRRNLKVRDDILKSQKIIKGTNLSAIPDAEYFKEYQGLIKS
ncbi:hypothetical protein BB559_002192 [Furculomyces boomerangus]|uniref:Sphingolipid delta4-desaturase N-terminal domain-containing protein n=2 Tax=Harpellales TaxID=61421 RepID=A0A2T9YXB7_9FUNG|nr:hypothetical protein BB559_002192 [Furculomyces boomerangus]PVZ98259.1 hypothetical protein BB558_005738 [Smittium angustum]PWA02053.1 hypothetical protein BB558_001815 [Smittium angustum]